MSHYIDAIVIPVPLAKLETYKRLSEEWGKAHLRHGALSLSDSISDAPQPGKLTSFPQAVQVTQGRRSDCPGVGRILAAKRSATASTRRSWRTRNSRRLWTPRRCLSTASECSGAASKPSSGSPPADSAFGCRSIASLCSFLATSPDRATSFHVSIRYVIPQFRIQQYLADVFPN